MSRQWIITIKPQSVKRTGKFNVADVFYEELIQGGFAHDFAHNGKWYQLRIQAQLRTGKEEMIQEIFRRLVIETVTEMKFPFTYQDKLEGGSLHIYIQVLRFIGLIKGKQLIDESG